MNWVETTKVVIVVDAIAIILYDVLAIYFGGREASISFVVYDFCRLNPIVACAIGIVVGHIL